MGRVTISCDLFCMVLTCDASSVVSWCFGLAETLGEWVGETKGGSTVGFWNDLASAWIGWSMACRMVHPPVSRRSVGRAPLRGGGVGVVHLARFTPAFCFGVLRPDEGFAFTAVALGLDLDLALDFGGMCGLVMDNK